MRGKAQLTTPRATVMAPWWPVAVSIAATCAMLVVGISVLVDLRSEVGTRAAENGKNLVHAMESDIARNFEVLGLSMRGALEGLSNPEVMALSPELRNLVLFDRSAAASNLGALIVFDAHGNVVADSASPEPRSIAPVADREYFVAQQEADRGLFISRPYTSRLLGTDVIGLSRRVSRPDGSFGGVVLATIELSYFHDLFAKLELGSSAVVSLLREDGAVMVRQGGRGRSPANLADSPVFQRIRAEKRGSFVEVSRVDGIERLYTFAQVGGLPLFLSVNVATRDIFAGWWSKAVITAAGLSIICGTLIVMTVLLSRELRRRAAAEQGLLAANATLSRLSITDPLTRLGNRRHFDEVLRQETKRAERSGGVLSLVLVDVDHFKAFNDTYGHKGGDLALVTVADALRACARRPGDKAFRVGGEEFALVLAETKASAALHVAEQVRARLQALKVPHGGSKFGVLTASFGVAEIRGGDPDAAFARADEALYRSKRDGRDRVSLFDPLSAAA